MTMTDGTKIAERFLALHKAAAAYAIAMRVTDIEGHSISDETMNEMERNFDVGCACFSSADHRYSDFKPLVVVSLIEELSRSEERERVLREAATAAQKMADAMETCHECKGTVLVEEQPTHCEDCSSDCDCHDGSECATLYSLHLDLKQALSALSTTAPEQQDQVNG